MQKRATRIVTGNYIYEFGIMIGILRTSLGLSEKRRKGSSRLIMLHKGLNRAASKVTNDRVFPNRRARNHHHSLAFLTPLAGADSHKSNFFLQMFTSLVRAMEPVNDSDLLRSCLFFC